MSLSTLENPILSDSNVDDPLLSEPSWEPGSNPSSDTGFSSHNSWASNTQKKRTIGRLEVAEVTSQLSIMTQSGVDLASAISSLASQCQRAALADVLGDVRDAVLSGHSFSDALKIHPAVFDPTFVATVAAGEASGRMAEVLMQLAKMQKNEIRRGREIRSLLTYPILLMAISGSVLSALVLFVLPQFTQIFDQYEMPLPIITQILLAIADELRLHWWIWGPLVIGIVSGLLSWRKTQTGRASLDKFWVRGPVVGKICSGMRIGETCRLLGLMLENGVTLLDSLRLTRQAIKNTQYKTLLRDLEEAVLNGLSLGSILQHAEIVPASAREMLITAENTGNLNEVTGILGEYYEEESEAKLRQLVGILEPTITVVMGAIVAVVVLAVMLPVFDLSTFTSGGN